MANKIDKNEVIAILNDWNSWVKDQLEDYLHQSVCEGTVSLKSAQQDIAGDWISAYQKYFHTTRPLATASVLSGVKARGLTMISQSRASARLETAHWGVARTIALGTRYAHRMTNIESSDSYSWLAPRRTDFLLWN